MARKWSEELQQQIIVMRMKGIRPKYIAEALNLPRSSIYSFLCLQANCDFPAFRVKWTESLVETCRELRNKGWNYSRIARKIGSRGSEIKRRLDARK